MSKTRSFISRVVRRLDFSGLYFNPNGIKSYHQLICSAHFQNFRNGKQFVESPCRLHIGFDGLHDSTTLLDTPIPDSPHFRLVQAIQQNQPLETCEYILRARNGTLDFRPAQKIRTAQIEWMKSRHVASRTSIESGNNDPVMVFSIAQKLYVADGKHRASICQLLGTDVACMDITPAIYDSFYHWVYRKMKRRPDGFAKHIQWFEKAFGTPK